MDVLAGGVERELGYPAVLWYFRGMEQELETAPRITINTTLEALKAGTYDLDHGAFDAPIIELQVFAKVDGEPTETRTKVSKALLEQAPQAKEYIGGTILRSIEKLVGRKLL